MHNATTKQRLSALRRKLGIYTGGSRWVRERRARLAALQETMVEALRPHASYAHGGGSGSIPSLQPSGEGATEVGAADPSPSIEATAAAGPPTFDAPRREAKGSGTAMSPERARRRLVAWLAVAAFLAAAGLVSETVRSRGVPGAGPAPATTAARSVEEPGASDAAPQGTRTGVAAAAEAAPTPAAPAPAPTGVRLEVRRGDTLWHLARVHLGDPLRWQELHGLNRDRVRDPDVIFPGQRLRLPER